MATLREVRKRIKSAQNIQQITKAMKMVAAAKLRKAQDRILSARPYAEKLAEVMADLSQRADAERFPLVRENKGVAKEAIVLVSADKGLCGSFNTNLVKETLQKMRENADVSMFYIGKKGMDQLKKFSKEIEKFKYNDKNISFADIDEIGKAIIGAYSSGKYGKVTLIYSRFQSSLQQRIVRQQLLPIVLEQGEGAGKEKADVSRDFLYEPSEEAVLSDLLVKYIKTTLYRCVLESQASEHGVRMVAMEMATNNAKDMIRDLTLLANKTRQAAITKEISEIVGGAEAIKG